MYASILHSIHLKGPLIHVLTNTVTNTFVADALLAAGCRPIMAVDPRETPEIASHSDALCINTGTPTVHSQRSYIRVLKAARKNSIPLVVDLPGAGASRLRLGIGNSLIRYLGKHLNTDWKTLLRGNASEILTLASHKSHGGSIDSEHLSEHAAEKAGVLLECCHAVSISGEFDVTLGSRTTRSRGAGSILTKASGFGCVSSALMAAFLTETSAENASLMTYKLMGDILSALNVNGPGTLKGAFIDRLYQISNREREENINEG